MYIAAFFTENGVPKTLLNPTIRVWDLATDALIVTDAAMFEVGDGWYKYNFATYASSKSYLVRCDGGAGLPVNERYVVTGNNEPSTDAISTAVWDEQLSSHSMVGTAGKIVMDIRDSIETIFNVETGRWKITNNQMIFYDENDAVLLTFDLFDASGNPTMKQVYERRPV